MGYNEMRTPVIALDYNDKHKAIEKEIMIDYKTGNIYVVSASDRNVIFDVTSKILNQLESVKGENVEVIIEGVGKINLTKFLNTIRLELNKNIKAHHLSDEVSYFAKPNLVDSRSLNIVNNDIQIKGFRDAEPGSFLVKDNHGNLVWSKLFEADGKISLGTKESGDKGSIIGPSNPEDGNILTAIDTIPYNGKAYLQASRRQMTVEPYDNLTVVLPKNILDRYSEIQWMLITSSEFCPKLDFAGNIFWDNSQDTQPKINSHNLYTFKTWTGGEKWIATADTYNNDSFTNVSSEYLSKLYYTKTEIDSGFFNKTKIEEDYYTKPETDAKIREYEEQDNVWEEDDI